MPRTSLDVLHMRIYCSFREQNPDSFSTYPSHYTEFLSLTTTKCATGSVWDSILFTGRSLAMWSQETAAARPDADLLAFCTMSYQVHKVLHVSIYVCSQSGVAHQQYRKSISGPSENKHNTALSCYVRQNRGKKIGVTNF